MSLPGELYRFFGWTLASVAFGLAGTGAIIVAARQLGEAVYDGTSGALIPLAVALIAGLTGWAASVGAGGLAGVELSAHLRRRSLSHTLAVDPDRVETMGVGAAFALAVDAELVGSFLVTTAPAAILAAIQLTAGGVLSARADQGALRVFLLLGGCLALSVAAFKLTRAREAWTAGRVRLTATLVERLIGQRTVALQEQSDRHTHVTNESLADYLRRGRRLDHASLAVSAVIYATGAALVILALLASQRGLASRDVAYALGSAFLVETGLLNLRAVVEEVAAAYVAARGVEDLGRLRAERFPPPPAAPLGMLVVAEAVRVTYAGSASAVLDAVDLAVRPGDRILLTGPSGAGKTTLVEVLDRRRAPTGGVVRHAPGIDVARVPQAGDDHLFHASLLFNVVAGRQWPPDKAAEADVHAVLADLGLGPLVGKMPAGVLQPIGDGGWRLSTGESARVRLARALVRRPDLLILDETFAPLDAATFAVALRAAEAWAGSLLVVAHP